MSRQGYFTHAKRDKTCPSCKKNIHAGTIIGISFLTPREKRKWLCQPCAESEMSVR